MKPRTFGHIRYVLLDRIPEFEKRGWMFLNDLGPTHGVWSCLMWRCECEHLGEP
jgi:hypothetical protein